MSINPILYKILADHDNVEVLQKILKSRILSKKQLENKISEIKNLNEVLKKLEDAGLIQKKKASINDLTRYFPTEKGLYLEKLMKNE